MVEVLAKTEQPSLLVTMASRYSLSPQAFQDTIRRTVMPSNATNEELCAFLMIAHEYNLNPILKEIRAFPKKGGGIQPVVSIDGWIRMANSHPAYDGCEFVPQVDSGGKVNAMLCRIFRKDRGHATEVIEYLSEVRRNTDPWNTMPMRMLRHKTFIQCSRLAFGFAGIMDEEEGEIAASAEIKQDAPSGATNTVKAALANLKGKNGNGAVVPADNPNTEAVAELKAKQEKMETPPPEKVAEIQQKEKAKSDKRKAAKEKAKAEEAAAPQSEIIDETGDLFAEPEPESETVAQDDSERAIAEIMEGLNEMDISQVAPALNDIWRKSTNDSRMAALKKVGLGIDDVAANVKACREKATHDTDEGRKALHTLRLLTAHLEYAAKK